MRMIQKMALCLGVFFFTVLSAESQELPSTALTNVMIHKADGTVINNGTIVWRNGIIENAGSNVDIPFDAHTIDGGDSLHVYPGFIDGFSTWGSPERERPENVDNPGNPGYERAGIQPHLLPSNLIKSDDKNLTEALKFGFTTASLGLKGEMLPGRTEIFFIQGKETGENLLKENTGVLFRFEGARGGFSNRAYPNTTMGVMARFRQLMYDAEALRQHINYFASANGSFPAPKRDDVLESMFPVLNKELPVYFHADTPEDLERFMLLKEEFGLAPVLVSGRQLWHKADFLKEQNIPVLASVEFPDMPDWYKKQKENEEKENENKENEDKEGETEESAEKPLTEEEELFREKQLKSYMDRVTNIKKLKDAGVKVGFAGTGMKPDEFTAHLKVLMDEGGLTTEEVIRLMSLDTAEILGIDSVTGEIEAGKTASFSVLKKPFGDKKPEVLMTISNGQIHEF